MTEVPERFELMRHFIAYHSGERMGRSLAEGNPLNVLTNKSTRGLEGNLVWFIESTGTRSKSYFLGSVFQVAETGSAQSQGFEHFASGPGHVFQPPIPLNGAEWFKDLRKQLANFSLGITEVKNSRYIDALSGLATANGWTLPNNSNS